MKIFSSLKYMKEKKIKQQKVHKTPEPVVIPLVELKPEPTPHRTPTECHKCTKCKISKPQPEFVQTHITKQCIICRQEKKLNRVAKENVRTVKNVYEFLAKKYKIKESLKDVETALKELDKARKAQ